MAALNARRLPTLLSVGSRLRSSKCFLGGLSVRPLLQEAEAASTRIYGAPKKQRLHAPLCFMYPKGFDYDGLVCTISESKCSTSFLQYLQYLTANLFAKAKPKPKPKPDIYIRHIDADRYDYFTAYSLQEDGTLSRKYDIYPPAIVHKRGFAVQCSCNGLVYFLTFGAREHLLWNPTTNEFNILPRPFEEPIPFGFDYFELSSGMWFDTKSRDYKVATLVAVSEADEDDAYRGSISYQILLYSLNSNSWKAIPCLESYDISRSGVSINGFYYALAETNEGTPFILSFDFSAATLSSIPLPDSKFKYPEPIVYNGLLGIFVHSGFEFERTFEVWVMMDGSWSREAVFNTYGVHELVWFSDYGKLLYMTSYNDELLVFDRATGGLKPLGIYGLGLGLIHLIHIFETSVQLKGVLDVEDQEHEKEEDGHMKPSLL